MLICWCNTSTLDSAREIARHIVQKQLAACVSIMPGTISLYKWENELHEDSECTLMIKTTTENKENLTTAIQSKHTYDVPEIIFTEVVDGSDDYLAWVRKACSL